MNWAETKAAEEREARMGAVIEKLIMDGDAKRIQARRLRASAAVNETARLAGMDTSGMRRK